jgi:TolB-like protein/DNA-binding winged helix-turn-helix (wHTH) protein/Flp pilus assembly protein TadD
MVDIWPPPASRRIDLAEEPAFDLGDMRVAPAERAVLMNGERRELQPRVMQVLVALAKARPDVLSRDKLIEMCWEGRIVGDDALNRCILSLRHLAQEFSPQPFAIDTVPRIGHRLIEAPAEGGTQARERPKKPNRWQLAAIAAAFLALVTSGIFIWQGNAASDPASIAVLPFRNLSSGDPYFAEGVGEEILGQLAREPEFRVAGRTSAAQFNAQSDPREVGRKLGVDYILEGTVRSDGTRVRINASLVKTRDGMRLWSETYDRKLEDILEIQVSIGQAVAAELERRLTHSPLGQAIDPKAYALYLNARGLLRSANPQSGQEAVALLQQAVRADPNFAAAWASLAESLLLDGRTKGPEGMIAILPRANEAALRALRLDPRLGQAHAVLGQVLGTETPEAVAHLRQAAQLDSRSSEGQIAEALASESSGQYETALAALRRAQALDPLSPLPVRALIGVTTVMGDRREAEAIARRAFADEPLTREFALARIAWFSGDLSDAARRWSFLSGQSGTRWASGSRLSLEDTLYMLKLSPALPSRPPLPTAGSARFGPAARVWMKEAPSPVEWRKRNSSAAAALVYYDDNIVAAKLMLNAGRARELVETYDGPTGLLSIKRGRPLGPCQLDEAAIVAVALRAAGRRPEAEGILREADEVIHTLQVRGRVPVWVDSDAAAIWAARGKIGPAVEALDRALRRGSVHAGRIDLPDLADEPPFRSLAADPRFKAVRARYAANFARERRETALALKIEA